MMKQIQPFNLSNKVGGFPGKLDLNCHMGDGDNMLGINDLPTEILSRVFTYFTATELLVVKKVCIFWHDIVKQDKAIWNHVPFSAADLDVKTTANLLKEMPLLRSIELCNVHSPEDMAFLTRTLSDACWDLRHIHFPDSCDWHPSMRDLHLLMYNQPRITSLHLCTKQKLTSEDLSNLGTVLSDFSSLKHLKLVGYYWHQAELFSEVIAKLNHLSSLALPSIPGITGNDIKHLRDIQQQLEALTINTSSLTGAQLGRLALNHLKVLEIIDSATMTPDKLIAINNFSSLTSLNVNLSNSTKEIVLSFFGSPHLSLKKLTVSNCEYSDNLLQCLPQHCPSLRTLIWLNPKDVTGEVTDTGILAITHLPQLQAVEIKSRSVSRVYYAKLAAMRSLKYARINGLHVPGCL